MAERRIEIHAQLESDGWSGIIRLDDKRHSSFGAVTVEESFGEDRHLVTYFLRALTEMLEGDLSADIGEPAEGTH